MTESETKIKNFYITTLLEILNGTSLCSLSGVIKDFEDEELYEECEGIKRALEMAEKSTMEEIQDEYSDLIINYDK
jgi:hypothetical protein